VSQLSFEGPWKDVKEMTLRKSQEAVLTAAETYLVNFADFELVRTYESMADRFELPCQSPSGIRTRRKELCDLRMIVDTGLKVEHRGHQHTLWKVKRAPGTDNS
jgi:hypothetical protein